MASTLKYTTNSKETRIFKSFEIKRGLGIDHCCKGKETRRGILKGDT